VNSFPEDIEFRLTWRSYQARVLSELEEHLDDSHLHIIAAPGSGKTVLGLEVVRLLNRPTVIFSPTIAIRDQWIDRFIDLFCPPGLDVQEWISRDIRTPRLLTVSTYQGLHSAYTTPAAAPQNNLEEDTAVPTVRTRNAPPGKALVERLRAAGVKTIVVDEAHHLRSEWWKCLIDVKNSLDEPVVVALTATPPYDVAPVEWERYNDLCGPIDSEIFVPELVLQKNLCPHQDYAYISTPLQNEKAEISEFRAAVKTAVAQLYANRDFAAALQSHPCITQPEQNVEQPSSSTIRAARHRGGS